MKRCIKAATEQKDIHIQDQDWYRLITRLEHQTGMKVTPDSKWDEDRDTLVLEDPKTGKSYDVEIEKVTYYVIDEKNFPWY